MKFALLIHVDEAGFNKASKEQIDQVLGAYRAWGDAMRKAGVYVGSDRLQPSPTASTVRNSGGRTIVLDGPYVEAKEQFGGLFVVDVADKKAAVDWAVQCPTVTIGQGSVEVRAIWEM